MKTVTLCTTLVVLLSVSTASAGVGPLNQADEEATQVVAKVVERSGGDPGDTSCPPFLNPDGSPNRDCYCPQPEDPLGLCE